MKISTACLAVLFSIGSWCGPGHAQTGPSQDELNAADVRTDWLLPNHGYAGQRYVDLQQITRDNASQLRPVCLYNSGDLTRFPCNPLVYDGVMYITTGSVTVALDAATCVVRWRHDWKPKAKEAPLTDTIFNPYTSRGTALKAGKLVRSTPDGHLIALDAATGKLAWAKLVSNAEKYELLVMAPLIYEDLVITGIGMSEYGVKGWIGAFRLTDGERVWRFHTVPNADEPGADTWSNAAARERGGGGVWVTPALDRDKGLLYVAVGNPAPDFFGDVRTGANLYTAAMVVLDIRTGTLQWYMQAVPHDVHDWDLTITSPLYTASVGSVRRALMAVGGKDGLLRVVDRESREQLFEVSVTTRSNVETEPTREGVYTCPGVLGGLQWSAPAFHPGANLLFAPAVDWCGTFQKADALHDIPGQLYLGGSYTHDPVETSRGWLTAFNAATGEVAWKYQSKRPSARSLSPML